jgi:hypothetical protein
MFEGNSPESTASTLKGPKSLYHGYAISKAGACGVTMLLELKRVGEPIPWPKIIPVVTSFICFIEFKLKTLVVQTG